MRVKETRQAPSYVRREKNRDSLVRNEARLKIKPAVAEYTREAAVPTASLNGEKVMSSRQPSSVNVSWCRLPAADR